MQTPTTEGNSLTPQTAVKMQTNSASTQAAPKPDVKPKFSCGDCSFTCNSVLNFRIHLQTEHGRSSEEIQNLTTLKAETPTTPVNVPIVQAAVNVQTVQPGVKAAVNVQTGAVPVSSGSNVAKVGQPITGAVPASSGSHVAKGKDGKTEKKKKKSGSKSGSSKDDPNKYKAFIIREPVLYGKKKGKSGTTSGSSGRELIKLRDYVIRTEREPLIGLEYVLEYLFLSDTDEIETKYYCELCDFDTDVDPMVEHMASFGHRKLYLAKEFPYVLKAQSSSKEDPSKFIRRMALEIEKEEGTKKYKVDPSIWMETMGTMKAEERKLKRKSRWDVDRNDATRMRKALTFLETFEVENEHEATTVTKLCEKLSAHLESFKKKLQKEAHFPVRVPRPQNVAPSFMHNAPAPPTCFLRPPLINLQPTMRPLIMNIPKTLPGNANVINNAGMRFPGMRAPRPNFPNMNPNHNMPNIPPNQQGPRYPFVPPNEKPAIEAPSMSKTTENPEKAEKPPSDDSFLKNLSQEDTQFFKKLKALLEVLPQNASLSDNAQTNSKLMTLKSLLGNQKSGEHEQANQNLMERVTSMVQDTMGVQNATVNQQLMMFMTSQKSSTVVMQTSSVRNNSVQLNENSLTPKAGLGSGNMQMNSIKPLMQNLVRKPQRLMGETYQGPGGKRNYPSTSQNYGNSSYGKSMEGRYASQRDTYIGQRDGNSNNLTTREKDQTEEPTPFSIVPLMQSSPLNRYGGYNTSDFDDPESDPNYTKRAKLDMDNRIERPESYPNRPLDSVGMNRASMPQGVLKKVQGKDLFTGK